LRLVPAQAARPVSKAALEHELCKNDCTEVHCKVGSIITEPVAAL